MYLPTKRGIKGQKSFQQEWRSFLPDIFKGKKTAEVVCSAASVNSQEEKGAVAEERERWREGERQRDREGGLYKIAGSNKVLLLKIKREQEKVQVLIRL